MYIKGLIEAILDIACLLIVCWALMKLLFNHTIDETDIAAALAIRAIIIHYTDFEQLKDK